MRWEFFLVTVQSHELAAGRKNRIEKKKIVLKAGQIRNLLANHLYFTMCRQIQIRYHLSVHNGDIGLYTACIVNMSSVSGIPWDVTEEELLYRLELNQLV